MIRVRDASKSYGRRLAVDRLSFTVEAGQICASLGPILNAQSSVRAVAVVLPVHYWQNWVALVEPDAPVDLVGGVVAQLVTVAVSCLVAGLVLRRRDPAA